MNGLGCVGAGEYGPEVGTEGDRPERRDAESLGRERAVIVMVMKLFVLDLQLRQDGWYHV